MTSKSVDEDEMKVLCLKWFNNSIFGVCLTVLIATTCGQSIQVANALNVLKPVFCQNPNPKCIVRYLDGPTYISSEIVEQSQAEFPAFTICADASEAYNKQRLKDLGIPKFSAYNYHGESKACVVSTQDLILKWRNHAT